MGVSKQAAQKRFVVAVADRDDGLLSRFTPPCPTRPVRGTGGRPTWRRRRGRDACTVVLALVEDPNGARWLGRSPTWGAGAEQVRAAVTEVVAGEAGETAEIPGAAVRGRVVGRAAGCSGRSRCNCSTTTLGRSTCSWPSSLSPRPTAPARAAGLGVTRRKCVTRVERDARSRSSPSAPGSSRHDLGSAGGGFVAVDADRHQLRRPTVVTVVVRA